jgi:hypothetical protein
MAGVLDQLTPLGQGTLLIVLAGIFMVCGLVMLWLGKYLTRGFRFMFTLVIDWIRKVAANAGNRMFPREDGAIQFDKIPGFRARPIP